MDFNKNVKPVTTVLNSSKQSDINKLAMELTTKLTQVDKLLVNLRAKKKLNLICVFSLPSRKRETKVKPPKLEIDKGNGEKGRNIENAFKRQLSHANSISRTCRTNN